jgi:hypothetical protein
MHRPMDQKRASDDVAAPAYRSKAARFNAHTLKRLQAAVEQDPEIDLTTRLPMDYSSRLTEMRDASKDLHSERV